MRRHTRRIILAITAPIIFVVAIVWLTMSHAPSPQYQGRTALPGMAGVSDHLVNLWVNPHPAKVGEVELTAQVASTIGTPVDVGSIRFELTPPGGGERIDVPASPATDGNHPEYAYAARATFDRAGTWQITPRFAPGGASNAATFAVEVDN